MIGILRLCNWNSKGSNTQRRLLLFRMVRILDINISLILGWILYLVGIYHMFYFFRWKSMVMDMKCSFCLFKMVYLSYRDIFCMSRCMLILACMLHNQELHCSIVNLLGMMCNIRHWKMDFCLGKGRIVEYRCDKFVLLDIPCRWEIQNQSILDEYRGRKFYCSKNILFHWRTNTS